MTDFNTRLCIRDEELYQQQTDYTCFPCVSKA